MINISKQQRDDAKKIIREFKERPSSERIILMPFKEEQSETQLESGLFLPPKVMTESFTRTDNRENRYKTIRLDNAVVVACSEDNKYSAKVGDIVRFSPVSALDFEYREYQLLIIYGLDLFIFDRNVNDDDLLCEQVKKNVMAEPYVKTDTTVN